MHLGAGFYHPEQAYLKLGKQGHLHFLMSVGLFAISPMLMKNQIGGCRFNPV